MCQRRLSMELGPKAPYSLWLRVVLVYSMLSIKMFKNQKKSKNFSV